MSGGFELQPQDGGPRVALAPGETVIGRGPLLGSIIYNGEGNGTPLQYFCLANPIDGGAWWAAGR